MSWKIFEEDCPELATLGFNKLNRKIAYLATIKKKMVRPGSTL